MTHWPCRKGSQFSTVPIGKPIANTQIYVLDSYMNPTPIGVSGELHIGGVQVARGYLNRPELTAERFIADPFSSRQISSQQISSHPDARLYKTGDLVRYFSDGNIEYLGRADHQVKFAGSASSSAKLKRRFSGWMRFASAWPLPGKMSRDKSN